MAQALYRKWRPQTFDEIVGQEHVTQTLRNALASGWIGHAYLFAGLRGTGKTTMARLLAKGLNCLAEELAHRPCNQCAMCRAVNEGRFLDLIEIDAASYTGVDHVRELRDKVGFRPNEGRYKVYIIDEVHRFSGSAFDALLKTIEEPPEHVVFILATTEIHKVPATILSRCQRFDFRRISHQHIVQRLQTLVEAEKIKAEPEALRVIARAAAGSMRDAESLLDQLAAANQEGITLEQVQSTLGTIDAELVAGLVDSLVSHDIATGLGIIDQALNKGADLRQFTRQIVSYLREMLLLQLEGKSLVEPGATPLEVMAAQAERISTLRLVQAVKRFSQAEADLRTGWQPQLPLELALVETVSEAGNEPATVSQAAVAAEKGEEDRDKTEPPQAPKQQEPAAKQREQLPPAPSPQAPRASQGASDGLTLEMVRQSWSRVLETVRSRDRSVQALLNSTRPLTAQDETVTLWVAHRFARDQLSQGRKKRLVEDALSQVFSRKCRVEYQLADASDFEGELVDDTDNSLPADPPVSSQDSSPADALADDPIVRAMTEIGGEVRPINEGSET